MCYIKLAKGHTGNSPNKTQHTDTVGKGLKVNTMMTTYTLNEEHKGIEITFDAKPNIETRAALKENGFRWHRQKALWYAKQTPERIELAERIANGEEVKPSELVTGGEVSEGYLGASRWDGYKSNLHLYGADLSKAIRQDIKAHGIKGVSVRVHSYAGGQSITATVKAKESDFIPFEEWVEGKNILDFAQYGRIIDDEETYHQIDIDDYVAADDARKEELFEMNARRIYYAERECAYLQYSERCTTFTDSFRAKIEKINAIILTFNYDDSNSMVDYFNTNFYYNIKIKMMEA